MAIAEVPAGEHVAHELALALHPVIKVFEVTHERRDVHAAHGVHHSESNGFLDEDLGDLFAEQRLDLVDLIVRRLNDPLVDPVFHGLVTERKRGCGPVACVLFHPHEERHVLGSERPQDDGGECRDHHDHQQCRIHIADAITLASMEVREQKSSAEDEEHIPLKRDRQWERGDDEGV